MTNDAHQFIWTASTTNTTAIQFLVILLRLHPNNNSKHSHNFVGEYNIACRLATIKSWMNLLGKEWRWLCNTSAFIWMLCYVLCSVEFTITITKAKITVQSQVKWTFFFWEKNFEVTLPLSTSAFFWILLWAWSGTTCVYKRCTPCYLYAHPIAIAFPTFMMLYPYPGLHALIVMIVALYLFCGLGIWKRKRKDREFEIYSEINSA